MRLFQIAECNLEKLGTYFKISEKYLEICWKNHGILSGWKIGNPVDSVWCRKASKS